MSDNFLSVPKDLPQPTDDGGADHLVGLALPDIALPSTKGPPNNPNDHINLAHYAPLFALYIYPMTGVPETALPDGWDDMPGARGCTPQSCALRDYYAELRGHGAELAGLSSQSPAYQLELSSRLHLPYPILSDANFAFAEALRLPEFTLNGARYLRRLTMICHKGVIAAVHYPVFPSTADPAWLEAMLPKILTNA